jgi:hypothetical protein
VSLLDDYHVITAPVIHEALAFLLAHATRTYRRHSQSCAYAANWTVPLLQRPGPKELRWHLNRPSPMHWQAEQITPQEDGEPILLTPERDP